MEASVAPIHDTSVEDIRYFMRHLELWTEGCPLAGKRPLFMSKRNRFRRDHELRILEIAHRYDLPSLNACGGGKVQLLDAFDARADYLVGHDEPERRPNPPTELPGPRTLAEAIDSQNLLAKIKGKRVPKLTPRLTDQLMSSDDTLIMKASERFSYFRLELALARAIPGAQFNIGTVISLLGPVSAWGNVCKDRLPDPDHPKGTPAAATAQGALPHLDRLRAAIREALPDTLARDILNSQRRWLQARRAWENEMQWAGHFAFKWEPPKGKPKGHGDNDPVTDWGKRMLELQLRLARLTAEPARKLTPLIEAVCAYLNALCRRAIDPVRFLEPVSFRLAEASPAERKRRAKQRTASQVREAIRRASIWEEERPPAIVEIEDDYHYGPPHEWEIYPNWNGTGNLMYYYDYDIVPPWERSSFPKS